jgi:nucleoside phosphorylase
MRTQLKSPEMYTVGWIAALPIERAAATALLDDRHDPPESFKQHQVDTNSYTWGRIGEHNLVIASLPAGIYGIVSAATTASNLLSSLPHIRIGLLVGIGGGIPEPDKDQDIRLGDVVVSQPDGTIGGVIQYDLGRSKANGVWEWKGSLDKPPVVLLNALASLQAEHEFSGSRIPGILQGMWDAYPRMKAEKGTVPAFVHQGFENDRLFDPMYEHEGTKDCSRCDSSHEIQRHVRDSTDPEIHYGIIASGDTLVKDSTIRAKIANVAERLLCVEMWAAGLMDRFPCLVIRGVCDYADSHKNGRWQRYASATAAAYAKELLSYVPVRQLEATPRAINVLQYRQLEATPRAINVLKSS